MLEHIPPLKDLLKGKSEVRLVGISWRDWSILNCVWCVCVCVQLDYTPLLVACEYQKEDIVKYLIEEWKALVEVDARCHGNGEPLVGATGLHFAAMHNAVGVAELLIQAGCPLDGQDKDVSLCCTSLCRTKWTLTSAGQHSASCC